MLDSLKSLWGKVPAAYQKGIIWALLALSAVLSGLGTNDVLKFANQGVPTPVVQPEGK